MSKNILETERLKILRFSETHLTEKYIGWLNDPEVVRFSEQRHHTHTMESCKQYLNSFKNTPNYFWAIILKNENHIGNINAYVDPFNNIADIGILIGEKNMWGKGYAKEAWQAVSNFLFEIKSIRKITAGCIETNIPMLKLMKGVGMVNDGRKINNFEWEGQYVDIVYNAYFYRS